MRYKHNNLILFMIFLISTSFFKVFIKSTYIVTAREPSSIIYKAINEKRGSPPYDIVWEKDHLPHFRVFFWVPKDSTSLMPYSDKGINTDVSEHGPVENWNVIETHTYSNNEKLVFVFVPKTFVFLYGPGFHKVIHLNYK